MNKSATWASMVLFAVVALSLAVVGVRADGPATQPTTGPSAAATSQPAPDISPAAGKLLDQVKGSYANLKSLDVTGTIDGDFNIDGQQNKNHAEFSGSFQSGGKFRSEVKGDATIGFTGEKQFVFLKPSNSYLTFDAPKGKVDLKSINGDIASFLMQQDISLALALAPDAAELLTDGAEKVSRADDAKVGDQTYACLVLSKNDQQFTLMFNPDTHLLDRAVIDLAKLAAERGAGNVQSAKISMEIHNVPDGKMEDGRFAWAPPAGAQEIQQPKSANTLKGQPAPAFSLTGLDGKKVSADDLKGSVYILDFWATWCGPCVAALPQLDKIYQDLQGAGLKVYAVNQDEDKATVQKFVDEKKLTIPVLLDPGAQVGGAYGANAIPETVLVGKDGKVLEVFIGAGHDTEIRSQADAALKGK